MIELTVSGKQMDVGDALRTHVREKLEDINAKYFGRAFDVNVTFAPEGAAYVKTHMTLRVGKDIQVAAVATEGDAYAAFDVAAAKVATQLRRYKNRLRHHHRKLEETPEAEFTKARDYVLATAKSESSSDENEALAESGNDPLIVSENATNIQKMSVPEAVMRLDLSGAGAVLFRNAKNNALNMVYRRADGNIGWVEPDELNAAAAPVRKVAG